MKKVMILHGPAASGKTVTARKIAEMWPGRVVYKTDTYHMDNPFYFSDCTLDTSLVIIDEVRSLDHLIRLVHRLSDELIVNRLMHAPFKIQPHAVIVLGSEYGKEDLAGFDRSFQERIRFVTPLQHPEAEQQVSGD